jgi:tRNA G10  N-methylase Trm11
MTLTIQKLKKIAAAPHLPPIGDPYSRIAKIHKYWSRKPWSTIDHLIENYTQPGDLVLDPFCGSGVIGLQTLKAGRNFEGSDLNPFAIRLTRETISPEFDLHRFQSGLYVLRHKVMSSIDDLYRANGDLILYSIPSQLDSSKYNAVVRRGDSNKSQKVSVNLEELPKIVFSPADDPLLPDQEFPKNFYKDRFSYKGVTKVSQLFSERNLYALSLLHHAIRDLEPDLKGQFELCLTNTLLHVSKLKSERVRPLGVNNYWLPDDFIEENVWWRFEDRCKQFATAKSLIAKTLDPSNSQNCLFSNARIANATDLAHLSDNSIDYILTDPPYGDAIQYSELSFIWNCWLNQNYDVTNEIIINPEQSKDSEKYSEMLQKFLVEASRVLKTDKLMTISFHSRDIALWCDLAASLYECGFVLEDLFTSHGVGSPFTKNWASFSPKSDIYITVRNTRRENERAKPSSGTDFIKSLQNLQGLSSFSRQQLYDFLVLASVNQSMKGIRLTGLERKKMASLLELFEVDNG